jgi:hypothetical protein
MCTVFGAEALRDEAFDGIPNRFIRRTDEYSFRSGIEEHDPLSIIYGDDRVHRRANDACQQVGSLAYLCVFVEVHHHSMFTILPSSAWLQAFVGASFSEQKDNVSPTQEF